jgi:hypothetical protein
MLDEQRESREEAAPAADGSLGGETSAAIAAAGRGGFLTTLRRSSVRRLLAGQTVSRLGDHFYFVALPWLVLRVVDTSLALSLVLGTSAVTLGASTLVGGVLADRYGPRNLMLGADVLRLAVVGVLAACVLVFVPPLWLLVTLAALLGIGGGLFYPASAAMMPFLVPEEELQPANSLDQLALQTSNFVGPSIAGALLAVTQLALGFVIDALSFAVSVASLFAIPLPKRTTAAPARQAGEAAAGRGRGIAALGEAFAFLRATPFLSALLGVSLIGNFAVGGLIEVATPLLLKHWVGLAEGPRALGIVIGGFGLGSIFGAVVAGMVTKLPHKPLVAIVLIVPVAGLIAWMPFAEGVLPLAGIFAAMGLALAISNVLFITLIQRFIPIEMMGRMMSITLLGTFVGTPLSIFAYGAAATVVPSVATLFLAGAALLGFACLLALTRRVIWQTP